MSKTFYVAKPVRRPSLRLFCFPYAGGGATIFRGWQQRLPDDIELVAVRLPGRESRLNEPPYTSWAELAADLALELPSLGDARMAFFGHSFGAMVAFEVAEALRGCGAAPPDIVFVSACRAPSVPSRMPVTIDWPEDRFWQWVGDLNGTPEIIIKDHSFRELVGTALRADLRLAGAWPAFDASPIDVPIVGFCGASDAIARAADMHPWAAYTSKAYRGIELSGDHFFLHDREAEIVANIVERAIETTNVSNGGIGHARTIN